MNEKFFWASLVVAATLVLMTSGQNLTELDRNGKGNYF
jgi:hypothetical protein